MELLVDLFGYLSIIVHGLTILSQSMAIGGVLFLVLLARPLASRLGAAGQGIAAGTAWMAGYAAIGLLLAEAATVALQTAVLIGTVDLSVGEVLGAGSPLPGWSRRWLQGCLAAVLLGWRDRAPSCGLAGAGSGGAWCRHPDHACRGAAG